MANLIQFKRSASTYNDRSGAISALNTLVFKIGEPVVVQYKSQTSIQEADRFLLAIGIGEGAGKYKLVGTFDEEDALSAKIEQIRSQLNSHASNNSLHKTEADRTAISFVGTVAELPNIVSGGTLSSNLNWCITAITELANNAVGAIESPNKTITARKRGEYENTWDVDVNLKASGSNNILVRDSNTGALSAEIDLSYTESTGVLTLSRSGHSTKTINLPLESFLESGSYNAATEEIWLVMKRQNGTKDTIKIPVTSLITEWNTSNTNTITLTKTRNVSGTDVLSADVNVSADGGNALSKKTNGLFVPDLSPQISSIRTELSRKLENVQASGYGLQASKSGNTVTISLTGVDGGTF